MNKLLLLIGMATLLWSTNVSAQSFFSRRQAAVPAPAPQAAVSPVKPAVTPEVEITDEEMEAIANIPPAAMTPEQKVAAQAPVMKDNKIIARNQRPEDLRGMIEAVNTIEKAKIRRANLNAASGQEISFKAEQVNVSDPKEVEDFLNRKTADTAIAAPVVLSEPAPQVQ